MRNRNKKLDLMKGLLIVLMVSAHTQFFGHNFIFLFHMPVFFMISGYFFNSKYINDFNSVVILTKKRIKQLYIPYIISNFLFLVLNNLFFSLNIVDKCFSIKEFIIYSMKILLFSARMPISDSTWFLQVLFFVTIIYYFIEFLFKNNNHGKIYKNIIYIVFLLIGFILSKISFNVYELGTILSMVFIFHLGRILHEREDKLLKENRLLFVISFIILLITTFIMKNNVIRIMQNQYYNPLLLIILSILGWYFIYQSCFLLMKKRCISNCFNYIGKRTLFILIFHMLSFKIVTFLIIIIEKYPLSMLSIIPVIETKYWYIIYTFIGIIIPLLLERIIRVAKEKIYKKNYE